MSQAQKPSPFDVLIIGSGFAGLCMAIHLRRKGRSFLMLEHESDLGGTWRDNIYPGCACDIPSILYSFSFEPNPEWSRKYPTQPELWNYLRRCAEKYDLHSAIQFNTEVREAIYDEQAHLWRVRTPSGDEFVGFIIVTALGILSRPEYPSIPGQDLFQGKFFHSARWDPSIDFAGKRVAVIGTGASAVQFIPEIAAKAERLFVFQRTPPWVVPKNDPLSSARRRALFRRFPWVQRLVRAWTYWIIEFRALAVTRNDPRLLSVFERIARRHLENQVLNPELRRQLTPDYAIGCKRILMSNDYYPALGRANVELVTNAIKEIRPHSIVTQDARERTIDILIYGTGFLYPSQIAPLRILGRKRRNLQDAWSPRASAYLGMTVAGFPNFFLLAGPNTGIGYTSLIFMIEAQVRYVCKSLDLLRRRKAVEIELLHEAQVDFNQRLQRRMERTVWASGCRSRYLDKNGHNATLWPSFSSLFWLRARTVNTSHYHLN